MRRINRDGPAAPTNNPYKAPSSPKEEISFADKLRQEEQQQAASASSSSRRQPITDETHSLLSMGSKSKRKPVIPGKNQTQRPIPEKSRMRTVLAAFGDCAIKRNRDEKRRTASSGDDSPVEMQCGDDAAKDPEKEMAINWKFLVVTVIALAVFHLGRTKAKQIASKGQPFSEEEKEEVAALLKEDDAVGGYTVSASLAKPMLRSSNVDAIKEEVTADTMQSNNTDSLHAPHHILHHAVFPPHLEHLSNLTVPYDSATETPYFFDVHFSGESVAEAVFSMCHRLTLAAEFGLRHNDYNEEKLQVFELDKSTYVDVDTSTPEGIARASRLGLADSHLAHIIVSPYFNPIASDVFSSAAPGRMFTVMRHPVDRAIGMYYYLARASWDPMYNPSLAKMTIEEYATSRYIENNWLTRFIVNKPGGKLSHADLLLAKKILKFKCLVGLYDDMEASLSRFQRYFGWNNDTPDKAGEIVACRRTIISHGDKVLLHPVSTKDEWDTKTDGAVKFGSTAWNAIARQNMFDMELYEFAKRLYKSQGEDMFDIV